MRDIQPSSKPAQHSIRLIVSLLILLLQGHGHIPLLAASHSNAVADAPNQSEPKSPKAWVTRQFDARHGLPQMRVQSLTRDSEGWIWCGTLRGLCRFDGKRFYPVTPPVSANLERAAVTFVTAGFNRELWVAYDHETFSARLDGRWHSVDATDLIKSVGYLRFGAFLAPGVAVLETSDARKHAVVRIEPIPIRSPSTAHGNPPTPGFRFRIIRLDPWNDRGRITLVDHGGGLVHARDDSGGWWSIDLQGKHRVSGSEISQLEAGWRQSRQPRRFDYSYVDSGPGGIWIGSDRNGLRHFSKPSVEFYTQTSPPHDESTLSISTAPDGSVLYSGSGNGHFVSLLRDRKRVWSISTPAGVRGVITLPSGTNWWVDGLNLTEASAHGVRVVTTFDSKSGGRTSALSTGPSGRIWRSGEMDVLETLDRVHWSPLPLFRPLTARAYSCWLNVLEIADGSLWVGSIDMGAFHIRNHVAQHHTKTNGAPGDILSPMLADPDGSVWFASTVGLLRRKENAWFVFDTRHGLSESMVLNVLDDQHGRLWVHGYRGVAGIPREDLEAVASGKLNKVRLFRPPDLAAWTTEGNGGVKPSASRDAQGNLWFATETGPLCVPSEQLAHRESLPPVIVSISGSGGTSWDDLRQPPTNLFKLAPLDRDQLLFSLRNPARAHAELAPIQHRLDPHDSDWQTTPDDGLASYRKLHPGTYQFRVRSAEALGHAETVVALVIPPIWFQTWTFRGTAFAAGATGLGLLIQRLQIRRRAREDARIRARDEARRGQLARDLHDGIGAGLARISMLANQSAPLLAESAQTLIRNLDELIWVTDPGRDGLEGTIQYLMHAAENQLASLPIELRFEIPDTCPSLQLDGPARHQLMQLLRGALSNVIRHSEASHVTLSLQITHTHLLLQIRDNGRGFNPDSLQTARSGLRMLGDRTHGLDGVFECQSSPGNGTCVSFRIPLRTLVVEGEFPPSSAQP